MGLALALEQRGFFVVLLLRLNPSMPLTLPSYALGATNVNIVSYTVASALGMLPGVTLYCWMGDSVGNSVNNPQSTSPMLSIGVTLVATLILVVVMKRTIDQISVEEP